MVQFTDIHFGENESDDLNNMKLMREILDQEKPDLVICTGDVVSGYAWNESMGTPWAALQYENFTKPMTEK
jgi:predicted MPP superfamily phosphohydrolase